MECGCSLHSDVAQRGTKRFMYCGMSRATGVPWIVPRVCHGVDLGGGYEESGGGGNYGRRVPRVTVPGGRFCGR